MFGDIGFDWLTFGLGMACGIVLMLVARRRRAGPTAPDRDGPSQPPMLPSEVHAQVLLLRAQGRTIEAIKLVRSRTGCDLKAAKDTVDRLR